MKPKVSVIWNSKWNYFEILELDGRSMILAAISVCLQLFEPIWVLLIYMWFLLAKNYITGETGMWKTLEDFINKIYEC